MTECTHDMLLFNAMHRNVACPYCKLEAVESELHLMQGDTVESSQAGTHASVVDRLLRVVETGKNRYAQ